MKLLGAIEAGIGNKIGSLREIIMARYVQKAWRGYVARKRVRELREKRKAFAEKYGLFEKKKAIKSRDQAVRIIAKQWRAYASRKKDKLANDKA